MASVLNFGGTELERAYEEWGCNCGPSALAAALGITLPEARSLLPHFEERGYTNPTMMRDAIMCSPKYSLRQASGNHFDPQHLPGILPERGLVRIQWTGPWTMQGMHPGWRYRFTHWIAVVAGCVFDINCGLVTYEEWLADVPQRITSEIDRADGGWYATHIWELVKR